MDTKENTPQRGGLRIGVHSGDTQWILAIWVAIGIGLAVVLLLGFSNEGFGARSAALTGVLLAGASMIVGGFIGFLFGIPRAKQGQTPPAGADAATQREYLENTNLEQISDWLTKIIVGITLVQFDQIREMVTKIGAQFGPAFIAGDADVGSGIAVAVILYFAIIGFLFAYLWTRIFMEGVLRWQSLRSNQDIAAALNMQRKEEVEKDAHALELSAAYLEVTSDPDAPEFHDLQTVVQESSLIARSLIFDRAKQVRYSAWRDNNAALVDRTLPIFRGLIAAEPDRSHRNYGQLGYAIVKSTDPDWAEAKRVLEKALLLRGSSLSGRGYYEFNLAITEIQLDPDFALGKPSTAAQKTRIVSLLDKTPEQIKLSSEPAVAAWAKLNGVDIP